MRTFRLHACHSCCLTITVLHVSKIEKVCIFWLDGADGIIGVHPSMDSVIGRDAPVEVGLQDLLVALGLRHTLLTPVVHTL